MHLFTCLVAVAVSMVAAAPLANKESMMQGSNAIISDDTANDRAKRAEELVYYGNQQNNARLPTKKSDPSLLLELPNPELPHGEEDEDAVVIPHPEQPITADLEARIEAAQNNGEQKAKFDDAVESAMHAAVSSVLHDEPEEVEEGEEEAGDGSQGSSEADDNANETPADEGESVDEDGTPEEEAPTPEETSDDVEKELQAATASESQNEDETESPEVGTDENSPDANGEQPAELSSTGENQGDVQDFLNQFRKQGQSESNFAPPAEISPNMNNYYKNMYQYMVSSGYPDVQEPYQNYPYLPIYLRRRRSSRRLRKNQPLAYRNTRHARRIKRDLFDGLGVPSLDLNDGYLSDSDDVVPLTDEEMEYLYTKVLPYVAAAYAEDDSDADDGDDGDDDDVGNGYDLGLGPFNSYRLSGEYEPEDDSAYEPEIPVFSERRPYESYDPRVVALDNEYPVEKRDMMDYYAAPARKRYFFPFSDEPETHWGAFVPEKRDYDEAIHRLQRLAMALSDEPGPYYSESLGEYKKK